MTIIWKDVPGYEGQYQVSSCGKVKSLDRTVTRTDGRVRRLRGKILQDKSISYKGYRKTILFSENKQKVVETHRLVALAFIEKPEGKSQVNHKDGNKLNNDVSNLEWVTPLENTRHAIQMGLIPKKNKK